MICDRSPQRHLVYTATVFALLFSIHKNCFILVLTIVFTGGKALEVYSTLPWIRSIVLSLATSLGFVISLVVDVAYCRCKRGLWDELFNGNFRGNLRETGLGSFFGGVLKRNDLIKYLILLAKVQASHDPHRMLLRREVCSSENGSRCETKISSTTRDLELAQIYMRYATAVYGRANICIAELELYGELFHAPHDTNTYCLMRHTNVQDYSDVWVSDLRPGEAKEHLRHAVVIDRETRQVVLTIRGTYSLTSALVAISGFSKAFHGGHAHAAAADSAIGIWRAVGHTIKTRFAELPLEYGLVVTGHSLGAGVANLLTIHLYALRKAGQLKELDRRCIKCFAFAPPPTFMPATAAQEAVNNTIAFVNNKDSVPSLSVHTVRHLDKFRKSQRCGEEFTLWKTIGAYFSGKEHPDQPQLLGVFQGSTSKRASFFNLDVAPMLEIPARELVWMEEHEKGSYIVHDLCCHKYADRAATVSTSMISDHLTVAYERAFGLILYPCRQKGTSAG